MSGEMTEGWHLLPTIGDIVYLPLFALLAYYLAVACCRNCVGVTRTVVRLLQAPAVLCLAVGLFVFRSAPHEVSAGVTDTLLGKEAHNIVTMTAFFIGGAFDSFLGLTRKVGKS